MRERKAEEEAALKKKKKVVAIPQLESRVDKKAARHCISLFKEKCSRYVGGANIIFFLLLFCASSFSFEVVLGCLLVTPPHGCFMSAFGRLVQKKEYLMIELSAGHCKSRLIEEVPTKFFQREGAYG